MKTKLLTLLLLTFCTTNAQRVRERFNWSLLIDPTATIKEQSPNIVAEIELESGWKYVKANAQLLHALEGGYLDVCGNIGVNKRFGYFSKTRVFAGVRLGLIKRGFKEGQTFTYPLFGYEAGVNYQLRDYICIILRTTIDNRADFKYSGAEPSYRMSNFIGIGLKL